jgi:hypothetical protein
VTAVTAIPIELIRIDGGTQIRDCKTQHTKVEEYVAAMATGADFPPLTVFWDGAEYWLADGFHRLWAYNIVMQALKLAQPQQSCHEGPFGQIEGWMLGSMATCKNRELCIKTN